MLEITSHRQGAILNHNHGKETSKSLAISVSGISSYGSTVTVNGVTANMEGRNFTATIELTEKINTVTATTNTPYGNFAQSIVLVWDKQSFRRFNFYIDDNIFLFTDLAKERPRRAFDHFYLDGLKKIHDRHGLKVTLNCFYRNDHQDFELKEMPDTWKQEFIDQSDWLKFSFHSRSEFPDRLYAEASAEEFGRDWDQVQNEIIRFAGESSYITPIVIHWANVHPAVAQECIRRGMRCYSTAFRLRIMGGPSLADRQKGGDMGKVEERALSGADKAINTEGLSLHYGFGEEKSYLAQNNVYYDPMLGIFFFGGNRICCNLVPLEKIPHLLDDGFAIMEKNGVEISCCASHEQYTFPYYPNYLPDHLERIECATRHTVQKGNYKPVFFAEGLMGNTAWGK
jgi:hypothetical protein